jgi:putative hemolysin
MELVVVVFLILLNGFFAMAEIAIISSRKSRLQQMVNNGHGGAEQALALAEDTNKFISTIQVGITLVGILAGAFGGATLADSLAAELDKFPQVRAFSHPLALGIVVAAITYLSLIGELIPKKLALSNAENIAAKTAGAMNFFATLSSPLVKLVSVSSDFVLRMLRIDYHKESSISEEEVQMLISEGAESGIFEEAEKDIIERTLRLDDKHANQLMTTRNEIVWLDIHDNADAIKQKIKQHPYSYYPVCEDSLDNVLGIIRNEDLLMTYLTESVINLHSILHKAILIPEGMDALTILEMFKKSGIRMALILDEYGGIEGLVSLNDILEAIVGDIPTIDEIEEKEITQREDGTWLVDGLTTTDDFKEYFELEVLPGEDEGDFQTVGGFMMYSLKKVPIAGDKFENEQFYFEVMDMDGHRVDKVLVSKK